MSGQIVTDFGFEINSLARIIHSFTFSILGNDTLLYRRPAPEVDIASLAEEANFAVPIRRISLEAHENAELRFLPVNVRKEKIWRFAVIIELVKSGVYQGGLDIGLKDGELVCDGWHLHSPRHLAIG